MRRLLFVLLICAALLAGGAAFAAPGEADLAVPNGQVGTPAEDAAIGNITAPEVTPPEVTVSNGKLSVTAQDAAIGNLISQISQQAGFEVDINPEVSRKTVTTRFSKVEIQKGIERLLSLIRHKDYFIYYGQDGEISKIEIHGANEGGSPVMQRPKPSSQRNPRRNNPRPTPSRPQIRRTPSVPGNTPEPPVTRRSGSAPRRGIEMPSMPINPAPPTSNGSRQRPSQSPPRVPAYTPPPPPPDGSDPTPYIPPTRMPEYIPPDQ